MLGKLRSFFARFQRFHNTRLVTNITSQTKEEAEDNFKANFETAKKLSDFVGMIVRFSFCQAATYYFFQKSNGVESVRGFIFAFCFISSLGVTAALGMRIFMLILLYESTDVHRFSTAFGKTAVFILAVLHSLALWYGVGAMLSDLRNAVGG